jgi:Spy/CpxP family protein refolding chaperone
MSSANTSRRGATVLILATLAAGLASSPVAVAEEQRGRRESIQPPNPGPPMRPAEVEQMWDTYLAAQAKSALGLDEDQFLRFTARLQALQNLRRRQQRQRNQLRGELTQLVAGDGQVDEQTVAAKLDQFDQLGIQFAQQVRRAYAGLDAVLTPRQRVRFRTFEERMAQRKLELLAQAREAARGRGQPLPGGRPPGPGAR